MFQTENYAFTALQWTVLHVTLLASEYNKLLMNILRRIIQFCCTLISRRLEC